MPNYTFRDKVTNEEVLESMKIAELDEFLEKHPNLEQVLSALNLVSPYSIGRRKTDHAFRERLKQIKKTHVGNKIITGNLSEV